MNHRISVRLIMTLGSAFLIGVIQGCGEVALTAKNQEAPLDTYPQGKIQVKTPQTATDVPPRATVTRLVSAAGIDFGNGGLGCAVPSSLPRCLAPDYLGSRAYHLNPISGAVSKIGSSLIVYRLTSEELLQLNRIFEGSIASEYSDLDPSLANIACRMDYNFGYATLITEKDKFELGSGSSGCEFDLYKVKTQKPAGLREFLEVILSRI